MPHLSLSFLGGFKIMLDGNPVTAFGTDKVRALLAYLVVESARPHRRALLAAMFWPELPQERAAHNLSQSLLRLRRALHNDKALAGSRSSSLVLTGQEVQFNPLSDYQLDVADFLELLRAHRQHKHADADGCKVCIDWLRRAADLYHGDLLAGLTLRNSMPFEEWQVVQREALHRQALEVLGRLADYYERGSDPVQVLAYARRLVVLEPWQERAQMQVMAALAQTGQEAAALEQYAGYSRMLAQEFGAVPSGEVTELYERIRARQFSNQTTPNSAIRSEVLVGVPALTDERRQATALLCQWQGTASSNELEEMLEGLTRFEQHFGEIVERYGGRRQQRHGSEFLAYFGYPTAQENAAWHAIKTALALMTAPREGGHLRIGIHTGMMVVRGNDLVGNVPDLARDCLRLAEPDSVMVTTDTQRLVRGKFIFQPMGVASPVEQALNYRVQGENAVRNQPPWLAHMPQFTRLVGREDELNQLAACLDRVQAGQGQIITVCGEPGIGKTRLTREFKRMCPWPAVWLESRCSPYFQNTSLHPLIDLLEQLLGFEAYDDAGIKHEKLTATLTRCGLALPDTVRLLSSLLGLSTDTPASQTITEGQRERMREVCLALFQQEAVRQPLMVLIEDLHWADPTTVAWLAHSFDALAAARCVLWLNWRPEFVAPWLPRPYLISLNLGPLGASQSDDLVREMMGQKTLSEEVRQQIIGQADGIPLFLEELTQSILDLPIPDATEPLHTAPIPTTLRDPLTARLDRAGAARETAQWAAAVGREFDYTVLREVVPFAEQRLQNDLAALLRTGLIVARDEAPQVNYTFKHALIQEAAYSSLLKRTRQEYHGRIAETLATRFPRIAKARPEILAQHYSEAGLLAQAADKWMQAGERATAQGATLEARTFFDRALDVIEPADYERRWRALLGRETVLDLREERAAQRTDIDALVELVEALNDDTRRVQALLRQASYAYRMEDYQLMLEASEAAAAAASGQGDIALEVQALSKKVMALARLERWEAAYPIVEEVLAMLPGVTDDVVQSNTLAGLALYYSDMGNVARSLQLRQRGIELARRVVDRGSESRQRMSIGYYYTRLGLYADARAAYEQGLALAEALGDRLLQTNLRYDLCYVLWCIGDRDDARALGERALQELKTSGYRSIAVATCLLYLGLILEDAKDYQAAAAYLAESRTLYVGGGWHRASMEVQAIQARCLLALERREEARQLASEVWAFVCAHGTVAIDFPSRVYLCIADVVAQVPTPGVTEREVLGAGYDELLRLAEMIDDPVWKRSFLEDELSNRALIARFDPLRH